MTGFAILAAGALLLLIAALALNDGLAARNATQDTKAGRTVASLFPHELLPSVFSTRDWDFVRSLDSVTLKKLFLCERKAVALMWIGETSANLKVVMRQHAVGARGSANLNPMTELRLLSRYVFLLLLCGLMAIAVRVAGPASLGGIARVTQRTFDRVAESHGSLQAAQSPSAFAGVKN